jgi:hypothetical protein
MLGTIHNKGGNYLFFIIYLKKNKNKNTTLEVLNFYFVCTVITKLQCDWARVSPWKKKCKIKTDSHQICKRIILQLLKTLYRQYTIRQDTSAEPHCTRIIHSII